MARIVRQREDAVDGGGLVDVGGDVLQPGEEEQHVAAGRHPDDEEDDRQHRDRGAGEPVPPGQAHEVARGEGLGARSARPVADADRAERHVQHAARVGEPLRAVDAEEGEQGVDAAAAGEEEEEDAGDRDRARDRREVVGRPEEREPLEAALVEQQGEGQGEHGLDRHDHQHVVEVVAQRGREVAAGQGVLGQQLAVVVGADEAHARAERRAAAGPVADAHPERDEDRQHEEEPEDDDDGRGEEPAGARLGGPGGAASGA